MSSGNNQDQLNAIRQSHGKNLFHFFVFSNVFIACCAVAMVEQTYLLFIQTPVNTDFILFVIFSTLCSYSFHWWLTSTSVLPSSRVKWLQKNKAIHLILFIAGLIGSAIYFFRLMPFWHWLILSAVVTFLYSAPKIPHPIFRALRKVALGKTIFLAFIWMNVTTFLPLVISGQDWKTEYSLFIIHRFFLIYAICILFDYRDRADDIVAGIRSLITYLNEKGIFYLFSFSLLLFLLSTIALYWFGYSWPVIIVLLIPGILTALLYNKAKKDFSDLFFYFILDGLMALSSFIMLIPLNWLNLRS